MPESNDQDISKSFKTLRTLHRMKRSVKMRYSDPDAVMEMIDMAIKEAIALRAASNGVLGKGAIKELKQIRQDLITKQVRTGGRNGEAITKLSLVLDQIGDNEKQSKEERKRQPGVIGNTLGSIGRALPSADTLISALITANPFLGYGAKIGKDVFGGIFNSLKMGRGSENEKIRALLDEKEELDETQNQQISEVGVASDEVVQRLDEIKVELEHLTRIWSTPTSGDSALDELLKANEDTNETLQRLSELSSDQNENLERLHDLEESSLIQQKRDKDSSRLVGTEDKFENVSDLFDNSIEKEGSLGFLDKLGIARLAGLGGLGGGLLGGMFASIGTVFTTIIRSLVPAAAALGKIALISGVVISVINGIKGFFEGFFNAREVLGLSEDAEITISDKIKAAFAGLIAGLLSPLNWVLDFLGLSFAEDEKDLRDKVVNLFPKISEFFENFFENITDFFSIDNLRENVLPQVLNILFKPFGLLKVLGDSVDAIFGTTFGETVGEWQDKILDFVSDTIDSVIDKVKNIFKDIKDYVVDNVKSLFGLTDFLSDNYEDAKENVKETFNDIGNSLLDFVGLGGNDDDEQSQRLKEIQKEIQKEQCNEFKNSMTEVPSPQYGEFSSGQMNANMVNAPTNVSNVINNNTLMNSTGARNNDISLNRALQKQYAN